MRLYQWLSDIGVVVQIENEEVKFYHHKLGEIQFPDWSEEMKVQLREYVEDIKKSYWKARNEERAIDNANESDTNSTKADNQGT